MKILIVEDEDHIAQGLRFNLEAEGYEAEIASTGEEGLAALGREQFDAVVLDIMLPRMDGFEVAKELRMNSNYVPVLMLTARGRPEDVLKGFEAGADDYLPKPFDLEIFMARLNGLLRRSEWAKRAKRPAISGIQDINGKKIDLDNLELTSGGETVRLTLMEIKLLRYLIENEGRNISRKTILEDVWDLQEDTDTRAIDNFIVRLRKYLEDEPNNPQILLTVRGIGYKFVRPGGDES